MSNSLYSILSIGPDASAAAIKEAFRRAARKAHPDKGGTAEAMALVNKANDILSDPHKRQHYDETGETGDAVLTLEQRAIGVLQTLFIQAVFQTIEQETVDPIKTCIKTIKDGMQQYPGQMAKQSRLIERLEKAQRKQLKGRKQSTVLEAALSTRILGEQNKLAEMDLMVQIGPFMLKMLKDYSWEVLDDPFPKRAASLHDLEAFINSHTINPCK